MQNNYLENQATNTTDITGKNPVRLFYFGARNYIDVTTLSSSFFNSLNVNPIDKMINGEGIKILKPIKYNGFLQKQQSDKAKCQFYFYKDGIRHDYYFVEGSEMISELKPEPEYDRKKHFLIYGKQAHFLQPISDYMTYNLMGLGKALIVANTNLIPRVVKTNLLFSLVAEDYLHLTLKLTFLKNNFLLLQSTVSDRHHGDIYVKLLA